MSYHKTLLAAAGALLSFATLCAEASLTAGIAGGQSVVYSSVSNITWTADANLLGTLENAQGYSTVVSAIIAASPVIYDTPNYYDTPTGSYSGQHSVTTSDFSDLEYGDVTWFGAQAFINYLNSISYAGSNQWTLPSAGDNPQYGYNPTGSQFGELYYTELGRTAQSGPIPADNPYFTNTYNYAYWYGTEYANDPDFAWAFSIIDGYHGFGFKYLDPRQPAPIAWVVSPGNIAAVPVPGAIWLFGSGLIALLGLNRRGNIG